MPALATRVVICVFDGLRPDMVTAALTPNLTRFAERAVWFREARSVFPSMTRVATSSIATGSPPAVHGIVGNSFYFPAAAPGHVLDTSRTTDIEAALAATGGRFLTADTFADRLAAAGKTVAIVHTGSAGSAFAINPRAAENGHWTYSVHGPENSRTPEAVHEVHRRFGPAPAHEIPLFEQNSFTTKVFIEHVLSSVKPDVALIWMNEPDTSYHYKFLGAPETLGVLKHVDALFGDILDFVEAQPDADDIAIIAASDHGQITSTALVDLPELLTREGHTAYRAVERRLDGAKITFTGGNMGEIRILEGGVARRDAIARWLAEQPFVGGLFSPAANDVEGQAPGSFSNALVSIDHAREPDLVFLLASSDDPDVYGLPGTCVISGGVPVGGGMHGGLNPYELNTVLMLSAPGDDRHGTVDETPVGIIDIAPTVLDLLGVPKASTMTGASLRCPPPAVPETMLETGIGAFRQRLHVTRSGHGRILLSGGRA